jgi:hypothetical protein
MFEQHAGDAVHQTRLVGAFYEKNLCVHRATQNCFMRMF